MFTSQTLPFLILALWVRTSRAYFADWSMLGGRPHEPTCVDIPKNMTLCADIGYDKMRLPNLLDHDTLTEVQQQSGSWVPLLNVQCHTHTKLFLCSLFTPVCLESQIYPCRSLCVSVKRDCESRMKNYGYHWPDMLHCDKFPEDNDMCIKAPDEIVAKEVVHYAEDDPCSVCNSAETYENILDNYCRAQIVLRTRVRRQRGDEVALRRPKVFKSEIKPTGKRRSKMLLDDRSDCCKFNSGKQRYLIMGNEVKNGLITPTFILPWKKSKSLKKAVRVFKNINCTDPNLFTPSTEDGTILPKMEEEGEKSGKGKKHKGRKGRKWKRKQKKNKDAEEQQKKRKMNKKDKPEKKRKNKNHNDEEQSEQEPPLDTVSK